MRLMIELPLNVSNIWQAFLVSVVFFGIYIPLVLPSRSIDKEDVELILAMEKKLGIDLEVITKVLGGFA